MTHERLPSLDLVERAAVVHYEQKALDNPVLDEVSRDTAADLVLGFQETLGALYPAFSGRVETGLYRIYMDFTDEGPRPNNEPIEMIRMKTILEAFAFLRDILGGDLDETTQEFQMLAVSLEIAGRGYPGPDFDNHDARFGFLLATAFDFSTVTGLRRPQ